MSEVRLAKESYSRGSLWVTGLVKEDWQVGFGAACLGDQINRMDHRRQ
ncbi:MAG: hypothetical protein KDA83_14375 [Planctomycetales bacterium]|nr:hypothetical protein [Planctomycetales bacterium]